MNFCCECTYLDLNTGDIYGKYFCDNRSERHLANEASCNRFCRAYNRDASVARSAYKYSEDHSKSGCYLTTIICDILGMPDNNPYLNTMRSLRNDFLQRDEEYKKLLVEYDIVGPKIANAIANDPLRKSIAINYFHKYIIPITDLINQKQFLKATAEYVKMTNSLKEFYGFNNFNVTNFEIENADITKSGHGIYKVKRITSK